MRAVVVVVALLCSASAAAAEDSVALERARRSYEELRYDEASALLEAALVAGDLGPAERQQALLLKGVVEVIRGDEDEARGCFRELLAAQPDAALPAGLSPKITRVFDEVRDSLRAAAVPAAALDEGSGTPTKALPGGAEGAVSGTAGEAEGEGEERGLSPVALGVGAGAAVAAAVLVAGAGAMFLFARAQPPESSLGTLQLP